MTGPTDGAGTILHHIGVATRGIERELPLFELLGYRKASDIGIEPGQKVRALFIAAPGQPTLELLENLEATGPLDVPLAQGIKFYHFAYTVPDVDAALERALAARAKIVVPVCPAVHFRRLCFVMFPNMMLVEFVELHEKRVRAVSL